MALNGLLDVELSVPDPSALASFWERNGLIRHSDGVFGTESRPVQIRVVEGDYRHLSELHLSCEAENDLADIARRLDELGVDSRIAGTRLTCVDPVLGHRVVIDVGAPEPLQWGRTRVENAPGVHSRVNERVAFGPHATLPPRRLGHVVLGSPRIAATNAFYLGALGYKVSDQFAGESATFARIESDHHNLLIHRSSVGYLNHYALEMDDIDAVARRGSQIANQEGAVDVTGLGRHYLGSNVFWYLRDPAGNMFELFCDMDQIFDDDAWETDVGRRNWGADGDMPAFSVWGSPEPAVFFKQPDLATIAAAREAAGLP